VMVGENARGAADRCGDPVASVAARAEPERVICMRPRAWPARLTDARVAEEADRSAAAFLCSTMHAVVVGGRLSDC
jgi:hypothetical protein